MRFISSFFLVTDPPGDSVPSQLYRVILSSRIYVLPIGNTSDLVQIYFHDHEWDSFPHSFCSQTRWWYSSFPPVPGGLVLKDLCSSHRYQFRFLRDSFLTHLKGSVVLILTKASETRVSIPLDLSTWTFIPLPHFIRSESFSSTSPPSCPFPSSITSALCLSGSWCVFIFELYKLFIV